MFRKISAVILALALILSSAALADTLLVLVPNDPTNEGRALLLRGECRAHPAPGLSSRRRLPESSQPMPLSSL